MKRGNITMLTTEQQLAELDRVVAMCKGTKLEGKEALCVKWYSTHQDCYDNYRNLEGKAFYNINLIIPYIKAENKPSIIFAVAIIEDTPLFLEEPFILINRRYGIKFKYNRATDKLETVKDMEVPGIGKISIPFKNVRWREFRLYKEADIVKVPHIDTESITTTRDKQIGGDHYRKLAIEPIDYAEANYPKEQFIGFLRVSIEKYLARYKDKNGIEDLQKAMDYLERLIEIESKE